MPIQAAHFIHGQASATPDNMRNEAVYTFAGVLNGAGRAFNFSLFELAQGSEEVGVATRAAARQLLRDIYLPLLPWDATDRPDALDALASAVMTAQAAITSMAVAVIIDNRAYMGWSGDGRVYFLSSAGGIERFDFEGAEPVASQAVSPGAYLLLCTCGLWKNLSDRDIARIVRQAPGVQSACDQLVEKALAQSGDSCPLVVLVERLA